MKLHPKCKHLVLTHFLWQCFFLPKFSLLFLLSYFQHLFHYNPTSSSLPFSPTFRKNPLWCECQRGPFSLRWWHIISISSRPFVSTMCLVNKLNCTVDPVQTDFSKDCFCLVWISRGCNASRTNMWDKIMIHYLIGDFILAVLWFYIFRGGWIFHRHYHHGGHQRPDQ